MGGARINLKFRELYFKELRHKNRPSKKYSDSEIKKAILMHTGDALPGFTSMDMFTALINPLLEELRNPALALIDEVHSILQNLAIHFINEAFLRLPNFASESIAAAMQIITEEKEACR